MTKVKVTQQENIDAQAKELVELRKLVIRVMNCEISKEDLDDLKVVDEHGDIIGLRKNFWL
jgi:hypothetical protein